MHAAALKRRFFKEKNISYCLNNGIAICKKKEWWSMLLAELEI